MHTLEWGVHTFYNAINSNIYTLNTMWKQRCS